MSLVVMQTRLKNQMRAIMHRHDIVHGHSDLFGHDGRAFLNLLVAANDETLRPSAKWAFIEAAHGAVRKGGRGRKIFDP